MGEAKVAGAQAKASERAGAGSLTGVTRTHDAPAFHVFLGAHSLLIGLLPFYLPVWLWRNGLGLAGLSLLIGVSGLSFAAALVPWQRFARTRPRRELVAMTLLLEVVLVALVFAIGASGITAAPLLAALLLGVANGAYNAFFWTTQRVLFAASLGQGDAGRRYGNFQLFVTILLKAGIVIGGLILEAHGLGWLVLLSLVVAGVGVWQLSRLLPAEPLLTNPPCALASGNGLFTRWVFLVDGVFLLLESHFWTLSLFLVFGEDFARLGVLVVGLGIAFAALFWLARSVVDRIASNPFYRLAVLLYAASWVMRAWTNDVADTRLVLPLLIVVTFCSSIFRLTFNKRFFEHARQHGVTGYLIWKSRLSQTALGLVFLGMALALWLGNEPVSAVLDACYAIAAVAALTYLVYARPATGVENASLGHAETTDNDERTTDYARPFRHPQLP